MCIQNTRDKLNCKFYLQYEAIWKSPCDKLQCLRLPNKIELNETKVTNCRVQENAISVSFKRKDESALNCELVVKMAPNSLQVI